MRRRDFIKRSAISAFAASTVSQTMQPKGVAMERSSTSSGQLTSQAPFWPDGARMVISMSMQMEARAQPSSGAESPMPPIDPKYPRSTCDQMVRIRIQGRPATTVGHVRPPAGEGHVPHGSAAVDLHPQLAREIVQRGHEASGHGQTWTAQYSMTPEQERESYEQSIKSIERATGTKPVGFNAFWLRSTPHTLEILLELGFIYYIDDVSRDEPFLINVKGKPFAVVPYTLHMNDIVNYETRYFSSQEYAGDLKAEFDMLYAESGNRRRMMSVSAHDRIAGRPSRTKVLEDFIAYAQSHPGVVFRRKDEIARFALSSPQTIREGI